MVTEEETISTIADALKYHFADRMCSATCISSIREAIKRFDEQPTMIATMQPVIIGSEEHQRAE